MASYIFNEDEDGFILIPGDNQVWKPASSCLWEGPEWFTYYPVLHNIEQYRPLYALCVDVLELGDVGCYSYLAYLGDIKSSQRFSDPEHESKIRLVYSELSKLVAADSSMTDAIRYDSCQGG